MKDPYEVLGISPDATDDEVKAAYRQMARKYHPDNYADNPLSDLAQQKMQEINEAYDTIIRQRQSGSAYAGGSQYADIRGMIQNRRYAQAEELLDGIPDSARSAEWYFLKGQVLYQKGWLEDADRHFYQAVQMDPQNPEYRAAVNRAAARRSGSYTGGAKNGGCSGCDMCTGLLCADCCCECMGGDLIRCC